MIPDEKLEAQAADLHSQIAALCKGKAGGVCVVALIRAMVTALNSAPIDKRAMLVESTLLALVTEFGGMGAALVKIYPSRDDDDTGTMH